MTYLYKCSSIEEMKYVLDLIALKHHVKPINYPRDESDFHEYCVIKYVGCDDRMVAAVGRITTSDEYRYIGLSDFLKLCDVKEIGIAEGSILKFNFIR